MLIICGLMLNFFSFFLMKRITTTTTTTKIAKYISYLALIDSGVLLVGGLNLLTHSTYYYNYEFLTMTSVISCKLVPFLFYTLADYSVFIIVIMTAETCVDLWKKRRNNNNNNKSFQNYLLIGFFACLIINSHFILTHNLLVTQNDFSDYNEDLNELTLNASSLILADPNQNICIYVIWKEFYEKYWIYLDASIYSFIPFVFISIFNLLIMCSLKKTKNCFTNSTTTTTTTNNSQQQRLNNNTHLISILITINISFCVLSIPMVILQIVYYLYISKKTINEQSISSLISLINNQNSEMYSSLFISADSQTILKSQEKNKITDEFVDLLHVIAELLQYLNHGSNFVLCLLTSDHFKKETKLFLISIYSSIKKCFKCKK